MYVAKRPIQAIYFTETKRSTIAASLSASDPRTEPEVVPLQRHEVRGRSVLSGSVELGLWLLESIALGTFGGQVGGGAVKCVIAEVTKADSEVWVRRDGAGC